MAERGNSRRGDILAASLNFRDTKPSHAWIHRSLAESSKGGTRVRGKRSYGNKLRGAGSVPQRTRNFAQAFRPWNSFGNVIRSCPRNRAQPALPHLKQRVVVEALQGGCNGLRPRKCGLPGHERAAGFFSKRMSHAFDKSRRGDSGAGGADQRTRAGCCRGSSSPPASSLRRARGAHRRPCAPGRGGSAAASPSAPPGPPCPAHLCATQGMRRGRVRHDKALGAMAPALFSFIAEQA